MMSGSHGFEAVEPSQVIVRTSAGRPARRARPADGKRSIGSRLKLALRRMWRGVIRLHGSPDEIALGAAIGTVVAFSPTIGLQIVIAAFLATLLGGSRPAAILMVWITNPLTIPPVYAFTYALGARFWPGVDQPFHQAYQVLRRLTVELGTHDSWELVEHFKEVLSLGMSMLGPMTIGGLIVGGIAAAIVYPTVRYAVIRYRLLRDRLRRA